LNMPASFFMARGYPPRRIKSTPGIFLDHAKPGVQRYLIGFSGRDTAGERSLRIVA
jgi:hypothetical protein